MHKDKLEFKKGDVVMLTDLGRRCLETSTYDLDIPYLLKKKYTIRSLYKTGEVDVCCDNYKNTEGLFTINFPGLYYQGECVIKKVRKELFREHAEHVGG